MGNEVTLTGRAELDQIYKSLKHISEQSERSMKVIGELGKKVNDNLEKTGKNAETRLKKTGQVLRKMADSLYSDFKALMALQALQGAQAIGNKFKSTIADSIELSDSIRKVGQSFGIATKDFTQFHGLMTKGLGDIGASSEAAAKALEGLTGFGIKGQANTADMVKNTIMLASIGREKGNEQGVGTSFGRAITASGKNPNDQNVRKEFAGEASAVIATTGKTATEVLDSMADILEKMPKDFRDKIGPKGVAQLTAMSSVGGANATKAIAKLLSLDKIQRMPLEAQGFKPFDSKGNIDLKNIMKFVDTVGKRAPGTRTSLTTAGLSEEEAEGLARMGEQSGRAADVLDKLAGASRDVGTQFESMKTLAERFDSSFNRVKAMLADFMAPLTEGIAGLLGSAGKSDTGATLVVAASALVATLMAGIAKTGLISIFKSIMGTGAEAAGGAAAAEGTAAGAAATGGGTLAAVGAGAAFGAAALTGVGLGYAATKIPGEQEMATKHFSGFQDMFEMMDKMTNRRLSGTNNPVEVNIMTKEPNLRQSNKTSKEAAN